jgi:hypothetical protein
MKNAIQNAKTIARKAKQEHKEAIELQKFQRQKSIQEELDSMA